MAPFTTRENKLQMSATPKPATPQRRSHAVPGPRQPPFPGRAWYLRIGNKPTRYRKMISEKQLDANRRNALLSTGPNTDAGRNRSRMNALRHGLTGQVTTMTDEDRAAHDQFSKALIKDLAPEGAMETQLAQRIATDSWRLNRISAIEDNLFALGQLQNGRPSLPRCSPNRRSPHHRARFHKGGEESPTPHPLRAAHQPRPSKRTSPCCNPCRPPAKPHTKPPCRKQPPS